MGADLFLSLRLAWFVGCVRCGDAKKSGGIDCCCLLLVLACLPARKGGPRVVAGGACDGKGGWEISLAIAVELYGSFVALCFEGERAVNGCVCSIVRGD